MADNRENKGNNLPKLPAALNTPANKKFFDATVDQLYSAKDSEKVNAFVGRREGGVFDPKNDYYIEEYNRDRTWYQLEATSYSKNPVTLEESNYYFYDDLISRIDYLGGKVGNHDRLFSGEYYSYAPPIDYDKFLNYHNYYWYADRIPVIEIKGIDDAEVESGILNQTTFNIGDLGGSVTIDNGDGTTSELTDLQFTSGLRVQFVDATRYNQGLTVEGVGRGIWLVQDYPTLDAYDFYGADYITIERGAFDNNGWSRSNKWYHKDVLDVVSSVLGDRIVDVSFQGQRPIIEFYKDMTLYNTGSYFAQEIDYYIDTFVNDLEPDNTVVVRLAQFRGATIAVGETVIALNHNITYTIQSIDNVNELVTLEYNPASGTVADGEIYIIVGASVFQTTALYWSDSAGEWQNGQQKVGNNQAPLFDLCDYKLTPLSGYPNSTFMGNEIFSYKVNVGSSVNDSVLGFPLTFTNLGQIADIVFENDISNETYYSDTTPIGGYYYYNIIDTGAVPVGITVADKRNIFANSTYDTHHSWDASTLESKQRVKDMFTVFDDKNTYKLSVIPFFDLTEGEPDVNVYYNGDLIDDYVIDYSANDKPDIILGSSITPTHYDILEVKSYTHDDLGDERRGFFEIPQQLEKNPDNEEILEYTANEFTNHFISIMRNQIGFIGNGLGDRNNYRDTAKDGSLGTEIVQNEGNLLKAMLVSSSSELDYIEANRFSRTEYVRYKNKFLRQVESVVNSGWAPFPTLDDVLVDLYFNEVIERLELTTEYQGAFGGAYMVASGTVYNQEIIAIINAGQSYEILTTVDTDAYNNFLYIYDDGELLVENVDYTVSIDSGVSITITALRDMTELKVRIYNDPVQLSIPSTPSKMGMYQLYVPEIILDNTYVGGRYVLRGHDGSITPIYGEPGNLDMRDILSLEFERRIFNGASAKFKDIDYEPLLTQYDVFSGKARDNRFSSYDFDDITRSMFYKWANRYSLNFRVNEFYDTSDWRTWNYRVHSTEDDRINGYWRGIYRYYYDTDSVDVTPWQALGFAIEPSWWEGEYGVAPWVDTDPMWTDVLAGVIKQGERQGTDERFVRTGLPVPVDAAGNILPIADLITSIPGLDGTPKTEYRDDWVYGDGAPVEEAWRRSSEYPFSLMEALFLTRPGEFGEKLWDTLNIGYNPLIPDELVSTIAEMRDSNSVLEVHGENNEDGYVYRAGYQQWISSHLTFENRNITTEFGNVVRGLNVKLAHKLGGFTNDSTLKMFTEGVSTSSATTSLQVPVEDVTVQMYTGATQHEYVASGVLIKLVDDVKRQYLVQGYDVLSLSYNVLERDPNAQVTKLTIGGTPAAFREFLTGLKYIKGEYVRYNGHFYLCTETHTATKFDDQYWQGPTDLPVEGGITVNYNSSTNGVVKEVPYGTILNGEQEVFDFLIGYGDWLETEGWKFDYVDPNTNVLQNWLKSAKDFLFWAGGAWAIENTIYLMPYAEQLFLEVKEGYPAPVERLSNGTYSILDKNGVAIPPRDTLVDRDNRYISVRHVDQRVGIYGFRVSTKETEHIISVSNRTKFNDIIYDPILGTRQDRLRVNGFRTNNWIGKMEAGGYIIGDSGMNVNYENLTDSVRDYHNTENELDLEQFDQTAKHLIGYENRTYMDNLEISDDTQYQFYQGVIREKGTRGVIDKLSRSSKVSNEEGITVYEEWGFKRSDYGANAERINLEFLIRSGDLKSDPQIVRIHPDPDGDIAYDDPTDSIIDIDIDDNERWLKRPHNVFSYEIFPLTDQTRFELPNAGYVHFDDVDGLAFNIEGAFNDWSTISDNLASGGNVVWIAKDERERWGTYEVIDNGAFETQFGDILVYGEVFDNGENIPDIACVSVIDAMFQMPDGDGRDKSRRYLGGEFTDPDDGGIYADIETGICRYLVTEDFSDGNGGFDTRVVYDRIFYFTEESITTDGERATHALRDQYGELVEMSTILGGYTDSVVDWGNTTIEMNIFKNLRYEFKSDYDFWHGSSQNYGWIDNYPNKRVDSENANITITGGAITMVVLDDLAPGVPDTGAGYPDDTIVRIVGDGTGAELVATVADGKILGISVLNGGSGYTTASLYVAAPINDHWAVITPAEDIHREYEQLIDITQYRNGFMYDFDDNDTLSMMTTYDPYKGVIPGVAGRNITWQTHTDPSRYTNASDSRLINPSKAFDEEQVGLLWWDLSDARFLYYEQGDVIYRRDNWGKLFPGSTVNIYEWVASDNTPSEWELDGEPRNTTDYVVKNVYNPSRGRMQTVYYFWVKNRTVVPTNVIRKNRNFSSVSVANAIQTPSLAKIPWFAPISHRDPAYVFANVSAEVDNRDVVFQVNYKTTDTDRLKHAEWELIREGDPLSYIPDSLYYKMVDSLVGYDRTGLDVPDATLSVVEKFGMKFRPRQTFYKDKMMARKVLAQTYNSLMADINILDDLVGAADGLGESPLYDYVDWYEVGYSAANTVPTREVNTRLELSQLTNLKDGEIIKVREERYSLWEYQADITASVLVGREKSTISFNSTMYTTDTPEIGEELRRVMNYIQEFIFIDGNAVDNNLVFFAQVNYVASEQREVDWFFKTSYIKAVQEGRTLEQRRNFTNDPFSNTIDYINEVKPYQTKLRDFVVNYKLADEEVYYTAEDKHVFDVTLKYNDFGDDVEFEQIPIVTDNDFFDGDVTDDTGYQQGKFIITGTGLQFLPEIESGYVEYRLRVRDDNEVTWDFVSEEQLRGDGFLEFKQIKNIFNKNELNEFGDPKHYTVAEFVAAFGGIVDRSTSMPFVEFGEIVCEFTYTILDGGDFGNTVRYDTTVWDDVVNLGGPADPEDIGWDQSLDEEVYDSGDWSFPLFDFYDPEFNTDGIPLGSLGGNLSDSSQSLADFNQKLANAGINPVGLEPRDGYVERYAVDANGDLTDTPRYWALKFEPKFDSAGNPIAYTPTYDKEITIMNGAIIKDGHSFLQPDTQSCIGSEVYPVLCNESLSMIVDTFKPDNFMDYIQGWDGDAWDIQTYDFGTLPGDNADGYVDAVSFRIVMTPQGKTEYARNSNRYSTTITTFDDGTLGVADPYVFPTAPGIAYAWVGHEKISYREIDYDNNLLLGVERAVDGTIKVDHASGTKIFHFSDAELMPNPHNVKWINSNGGIIASTTPQARFLQIREGNVNEPNN